MNTKQVFSILVLLAYASGTCVAMQQQQQQQQTQDQQQKQDHYHHHDHDHNDDNPDAPAQDDELTDLNSLLQNIVDKVNTTHGSVDNMIKQKSEDHTRICPTCGGLASECPEDQRRIRNGIIMTCGCDMCGGRAY